MVADNAPCSPFRWKGYTLAHGLIWQDMGENGWEIFSINTPVLLHILTELRLHAVGLVTRWIAQDDNYRARGLYDSLSTRTGWITYEMTAAATGRQS